MSWADELHRHGSWRRALRAPEQVCVHLSLAASRKGVTYQRIELLAGKAKHEPVKGSVRAGATSSRSRRGFVMDQPAGSSSPPTTVTAMLLPRPAHEQKETQVRYLGRRSARYPRPG